MRILFATDGSATADTALDLLIDLPLGPHDHVTALAVPVRSYVGIGYDGAGAYFAELAEEEDRTAHRVADKAVARLGSRHIPATAKVVEGIVPQTILEVAHAEHADLIVVGSRGLGRVAGALLGSTARAVARHADVPVLVVKDRRHAPKRILVATDGSEDATAAIRTLSSLPLPKSAHVTVLYAQPTRAPRDLPSEIWTDELVAAAEREERQEGIEVLSAVRDLLLPSGISVRITLERGRATERILATAAAEGSDLIVLGARGRTLRGDRFLQGSTADRILESAHCAVLVARAKKAAETKKPTNGKVLAEAR